MDFATLAIILSVGSLIGTAAATFFAQRKSRSNDVLRATNEDYEKRIKQLEGENKRLLKDVQNLKQERQLPLDQFTQLIISNSNNQMATLTTVVSLLEALLTKNGIEIPKKAN